MRRIQRLEKLTELGKGIV